MYYLPRHANHKLIAKQQSPDKRVLRHTSISTKTSYRCSCSKISPTEPAIINQASYCKNNNIHNLQVALKHP
jgi:hypothetical protein